MRSSLIYLLLVSLLAIVPDCLWGQDSSEIERLATQTSDKVVKSHPTRVLIGIRAGCLFNIQLCDSLDSRLRADLQKSIQGIQFVNKEDVIQELKKRGFLSIDAYNDFVLQGVASYVGAETVVMEDLVEEPKAYEISGKIMNAGSDKEVGTSKVKIARPSVDNDDKPLFIKDPESGASLVVPRGHPVHSRPLYFPACMKCPDPEYPEDARRKRLQGVIAFLVTISEQGVAEDISLVRTFDRTLATNAVQTIHGWRFKPAIGPDGKPFPERVPLEVTYRLAF